MSEPSAERGSSQMPKRKKKLPIGFSEMERCDCGKYVVPYGFTLIDEDGAFSNFPENYESHAQDGCVEAADDEKE